jgi:hypothetical protein
MPDMRKKLALVALAGSTLFGVAAFVPSAANAKPDGVPSVEVRQGYCGSYNVYVNGQPLFTDTYGYYCQPPM